MLFLVLVFIFIYKHNPFGKVEKNNLFNLNNFINEVLDKNECPPKSTAVVYLLRQTEIYSGQINELIDACKRYNPPTKRVYFLFYIADGNNIAIEKENERFIKKGHFEAVGREFDVKKAATIIVNVDSNKVIKKYDLLVNPHAIMETLNE